MNDSSDEYGGLKLFFSLFVDWYLPKLDGSAKHPLEFISDLEKKSRENARRSLLIGVNDVVEISLDWSAERVRDADLKFAAHDAPTLSEVRRKYSKRYSSILKRGAIRNEVEYFMLKGILDGCAIEDETETAKLDTLIADYELKVASKR